MEHGASARLEHNDFSAGDATPANGHGKCEHRFSSSRVGAVLILPIYAAG